MLRILQGQNTETERLASLRRAGNSSTQLGPCPQSWRPLLLQGWGWKPAPAHSQDAVDRMTANTYHQCQGRTLEEEGGVGAMTAQKRWRSTEVPHTPRVCSR